SDTISQTFVIMARPSNAPVVQHEYRLVHARAKIDLDRKVVKLGEEGFHLAATSFEGQVFHGAFERVAPGRFDYLVVAGSFRKGWDKKILEDPALLSRLTRIVPMGDNGLVE